MKAILIGNDLNAKGRVNALKAMDIEVVPVAANDLNAIKTAKADCAIVCADCIDQTYDIARACHEAGIGIFLAQPYAKTLQDAEKIEALLANDKHVACGHPAQFVATYIELRKMINANKIGNIGTIHMGRLRAHSEPPMPMGVGMLSALEWIFGPIAHLYAMGANGLNIKIVVCKMQSGAIAHLEMGNSEIEPYYYYEVAGKDGLIDFDSRIEPNLRFVDRESGKTKSTELLPQVLWDEEMRAFVALLNDETNASVDLKTGARALRLNWALDKSIKDNAIVVL